MKEKKTAVITFRTEEWVKEELQEIANQNNWSQAQVVEQLCKNFIANPEPNHIIIKTEDLLKITKELEEEACGGAEIQIDFRWDKTSQTYYKEFTINGLETSGMGCIAMDSVAKEMTEDEIREIP